MPRVSSAQQNAVSVPSVEERITATYRQSACWLAALATKESKDMRSKDEDEAQDGWGDAVLPSIQVAQHLLDSGNHPGFIPSRLHVQLMQHQADGSTSFDAIFQAASEEKNGDAGIGVYLPCCKQCG